jgi:hypothetical protein
MRGRYWKCSGRDAHRQCGHAVTVDLHRIYRFLKASPDGRQTLVSPVRPQSADLRPQYFGARPSDFRAQRHRVWHTPRYPSHVAVQVLP